MGDSNDSESSQPAVRPKVPIPREPEKQTKKTNSKPIEVKIISFFDDGGNKQHLPALHPSFVHPLENFSFLPLPASPSGDYQPRKLLDHSIERLHDYETNLHILLRLPYHRFWSTAMYDTALNIGLRSYINNSPRFYFSETSLDERINEIANSIHKLVFKVYLRLSTTRESSKNFMSKEFFGKILMEKKIFDISLLMDICAIYGNIYPDTDEKLTRMMESVLESHFCYTKQLESSVNVEKEKLTKILEELALSEMDNRSIINPKQSHRISILNWSHLVGVVDHVVGTTVPVSFFLSLYPPASKIYRDHKFDSAIVEFYDSLFPKLKEELNSRFSKDSRAKKSSEIIIRQIVYARCSLINAFRSLVKYSSLNILLDPNVSKDSKTTLIDDFLDMSSIAASSSCFSKDYFSKYSFESDVYLLMENSLVTGFDSVDPSRIDYLFEVMSENCKQPPRNNTTRVDTSNVSHIPNNTKSRVSNDPPKSEPFNLDEKRLNESNVGRVYESKSADQSRETVDLVNRNNQSNKENAKMGQNDGLSLGNSKTETKTSDPESLEIDQVMLASMVSHIKDVFADMPDETIKSLLTRNNYDSEKVIDLILTEKIP